jgi:ketosteroid isomerase-like protein
MKANSEVEAQVKGTLRKFVDAYANRDMKALMECFAPDDDVVLYGTGADEKRVGFQEMRAQVERDWAQTDSIAISFTWTSVSAAHGVAWVAADSIFSFTVGGESGTLPARLTVVLEEREGQWLIVQSHFSVPAADQEEGHSV